VLHSHHVVGHELGSLGAALPQKCLPCLVRPLLSLACKLNVVLMIVISSSQATGKCMYRDHVSCIYACDCPRSSGEYFSSACGMCATTPRVPMVVWVCMQSSRKALTGAVTGHTGVREEQADGAGAREVRDRCCRRVHRRGQAGCGGGMALHRLDRSHLTPRLSMRHYWLIMLTTRFSRRV
jgi:hypothetical protein